MEMYFLFLQPIIHVVQQPCRFFVAPIFSHFNVLAASREYGCGYGVVQENEENLTFITQHGNRDGC